MRRKPKPLKPLSLSARLSLLRSHGIHQIDRGESKIIEKLQVQNITAFKIWVIKFQNGFNLLFSYLFTYLSIRLFLYICLYICLYIYLYIYFYLFIVWFKSISLLQKTRNFVANSVKFKQFAFLRKVELENVDAIVFLNVFRTLVHAPLIRSVFRMKG